jgi:iron complex transport system ATP-binding protein
MASVAVPTAVLQLAALTVRYGTRVAVDDLSHAVAPGAWLCLIGPNGAGKSTVLRAIGGLVAHDGAVLLDGAPAARLGRRGRARAVAYVPQRPVIPPDMTAGDYVLLGRTPHIGYFGVESARDRSIAAWSLARLDLDGFAPRPLVELSGGELQRVVLARALAQQAPLLLLDEPTSALDLGHVQQVLELVDELRHEQGLTVVSAMHDLTLAGQFADELLLMRDGRAIAAGPPADVLTEALLAVHYNARVRLLQDPDGHIVVVPARRP